MHIRCRVKQVLKILIENDYITHCISHQFEQVHFKGGWSLLAILQDIESAKKFEWTPKYEKAFNDLKALFTLPSLLQCLKEREILLLYLGVGEDVVNSF